MHTSHCCSDQMALLSARPAIPFLPVHLKDVLFAIEGCRASIESKEHIAMENYSLVTRCLASIILRHPYDMHEDLALQAYLEVRADKQLFISID